MTERCRSGHQSTSSIPPGTAEKGKGSGGGPLTLTGGGPKLNEKVGAGTDDEDNKDAFKTTVLVDAEVAQDLFAPLFVCSERARLSFFRCVLANEFRLINASAT